MSNTVYICEACGWEYDPEQGDPDGGIAPGTAFEDIPDDWVCPVCGVGKEDFTPKAVSSREDRWIEEQPNAPLIIVGSGLAGYSLAREYRRRDQERPVILITADGGEVYSKPMLSNALARHHRPDDMVQKSADDLAGEQNLAILTRTRVKGIDRKHKRLELESGTGTRQMNYGQLVLALGADARVFPAEGSDEVDIFTVNDLDDYRRWRQHIGERGRVLLIGAGLIGCEFANDLLSAGFEVDLVDPAPCPLARLLPAEIGDMLANALRQAGARLHMGRTVKAYGTCASARLARLDDNSELAFDHALSAVGLAPRTGLARSAGLSTDAGIRVDRYLRSSDASIHAIGDCAQMDVGPLPYIAPLLAQARALAATLAGEVTPLVLPAMPVVVKTPALPLVVCPPQAGLEGDWKLEVSGSDAEAIFIDKQGREAGFALTGARTAEQRQLAQRMPDLLQAIA